MMDGPLNFKKETPEEEVYNKHLKEPIISTYDRLYIALIDARNQFSGIKFMSSSGDPVILENLRAQNYLHFMEYQKTQNVSIDPRLAQDNNVISVIKKYDNYIDSIKNCVTKEDFEKLFNDVSDFITRTEKNLYTYIRNEWQFNDVFIDMKNQFVFLQRDVSAGLSFDDIKKRNKGRVYKTFDELINEKGNILFKKFKLEDKYRLLIKSFNDVVKNIKSIKTENQLNQIIEEINEFLVIE